MASVSSAVREATRQANEVLRGISERRAFTITKFGRHPDGYLHARVTFNGMAYYLHERYGSWMAPGTSGGRHVMKEPEALFHTQEVKFALAEKARAWRRAELRREDDDGDDSDSDEASDGGLPGATVPDSGVPED